MKVNYRLVYLLLSLGSIGCILALWTSDDVTAKNLSDEDALIQSLSAVFWFAAMMCCAVAIRRGAFVRYAWLWLVLCFAFLGEETSWFQRYLGYSVPVVERASTQSEFNIHNLALIPGGVSQGVFLLGMLAWFLVFPIAVTRRSPKAIAVRVGFPDPTIALGISMWVPVAVSYLPVVPSGEVHHAVGETRELLFAFFVLVYLFGYAVRRAGHFRTWPPFVAMASSDPERTTEPADPVGRRQGHPEGLGQPNS